MTEQIVWVRWTGSGRHAFPYPPGKEVELRPGFNKLTKKVLDAITGGIDSEGRARGGTGSAYWNAKPALLMLGREPMADEEFHEPLERVGVTKSRRSLRHEAERHEINDLRAIIVSLQAQMLGASPVVAGSAPEPGAEQHVVMARDLEQARLELGQRERELEELRRLAAEAEDLKSQMAELQDEARAAKSEAAQLSDELDAATAPEQPLKVDPMEMTVKQLSEAIGAEGVTRVDLAQTLTAELSRDGGPRTGAVEILTKAISGV
jgi:molecular chaperone GrpE (heat shock protein)